MWTMWTIISEEVKGRSVTARSENLGVYPIPIYIHTTIQE